MSHETILSKKTLPRQPNLPRVRADPGVRQLMHMETGPPIRMVGDLLC